MNAISVSHWGIHTFPDWPGLCNILQTQDGYLERLEDGAEMIIEVPIRWPNERGSTTMRITAGSRSETKRFRFDPSEWASGRGVRDE